MAFRTSSDAQPLDEGKFIKEATPIANKLNWDASKIQYLAYLLNNQVKSKKYDTLSICPVQQFRLTINYLGRTDSITFASTQ
jgi:hypothetical protein